MIKKTFYCVLALIIFCTGCSNTKNINIDESEDGYYYLDNDWVEGNFKYKIKESSYYTNLFDVNDTNFDYKNVNYYKDYINLETGELLDSYIFVMVDMYVENEDAISLDIRNSDNTIFTASSYLLIDTSTKFNSDTFKFYYISYFSDENECPDIDPNAYKLPQGESRTITIGFFADDVKNIEDLYISTGANIKLSTFIPLNLEQSNSQV